MKIAQNSILYLQKGMNIAKSIIFKLRKDKTRKENISQNHRIKLEVQYEAQNFIKFFLINSQIKARNLEVEEQSIWLITQAFLKS